jgi:hypothetical protein
MKIISLAIRAAVLLTTGPPLLAMTACTASTVTTLRFISGPAADFQAVPAATADFQAVPAAAADFQAVPAVAATAGSWRGRSHEELAAPRGPAAKELLACAARGTPTAVRQRPGPPWWPGRRL